MKYTIYPRPAKQEERAEFNRKLLKLIDNKETEKYQISKTDVYMAYSTSELALEYQNGNSKVRGKDSIRYVKLGDLIPE